MALEIRRARPEESAALTEIAFAAKRHWDYPEEYIRLWRDDLTLTPRYIEDHSVYAAVEGQVIVGLLALREDAARIELDHLWVTPGHMHRKVGEKLFRRAVQLARATGKPWLEIVSDPNAEGFYLKMGARRIGETQSKPAGRTLPLLVFNLQLR